MAVVARTLPQVEYLGVSRAPVMPTGSYTTPAERFFDSGTKRKMGESGAYNEMEKGALKTKKRRGKDEDLRKKTVVRIGTATHDNPMRHITAYAGTGTSGTRHGAHETANYTGRMANPIASDGTTAMAIDTPEAGRLGPASDGGNQTAVPGTAVEGTGEGRHVEADALNVDDSFVQRLKPGEKLKKIDVASLNYEILAGSVQGLKNLNNSRSKERLVQDSSFIKSTLEGGGRSDHTLSMLDTAAVMSEDPFGKHKYNAKPSQEIQHQMHRGVVNINHEGANMFTRGSNQRRNKHIRRKESDLGTEAPTLTPNNPDIINLDKNAMDIDEENKQWWYVPAEDRRFHQSRRDELADKVAYAQRAPYMGADTAEAADSTNVLVTDRPWLTRPGQSGRGQQGALQPGNRAHGGAGGARVNEARAQWGSGTSRISHGVEIMQGGVAPGAGFTTHVTSASGVRTMGGGGAARAGQSVVRNADNRNAIGGQNDSGANPIASGSSCAM